MLTAARRGTLVALMALSVACDGIDPPMAPTATPPRPVSTLPPPPPAEYPPINGGASLFEFSGGLSYPVRSYTTTSRYALDAGGTFALQYLGFEYVGSYQEEGASMRLLFSGDSRWSAIGTLNGDVLEVRYNDIMQHSDFEDATYTRSRSRERDTASAHFVSRLGVLKAKNRLR